jgi:hypothetical protein
MSNDVYERISSRIKNKLESGARHRFKPRNADSKERITHHLRGTSRADVGGVRHAAA